MAESSYEKVYRLLAASNEAKNLLAEILARVESASLHIRDVEFSIVRQRTMGPVECESRFKVSGTGQTTTDGQIWIDLNMFITDHSVKSIVEANFGVKGRVPTYFLKKDRILGEADFKKNCNHDSFRRWWISRLESDIKEDEYPHLEPASPIACRTGRSAHELDFSIKFRDAAHRAKDRIREQRRQLVLSEQYAVLRREFLVRQAVQDIKIVMSNFAHLGKDVLKTALDEYIVHEITMD